MAEPGVRIDSVVTVARPGVRPSAEEAFLRDADKDKNGVVTPTEYNDGREAGRVKLLPEQQNALDARFTAALGAGTANSGVAIRKSATQIPANFTVDEAWKNPFVPRFAMNFELHDKDGKVVGIANREVVSDADGEQGFWAGLWSSTKNVVNMRIDLKDPSGALIATAKQPEIRIMTGINVFDADGKLIGSIEEKPASFVGKVLQKGVIGKSVFTVFEVKDAHGRVVANSSKLDFGRIVSCAFKPEIEVTGEEPGNKDKKLVSIERNRCDMVWDNWAVQASADSKIDPRLTAFLAVYKSYSDNVIDEKKLAYEAAKAARKK